MTDKLTTLWRPVGIVEKDLLVARDMRFWPARLPDQPIFYPVLNEEYAIKIARDWNYKYEGAGYVTRFNVKTTFLDAYAVQQVGGQTILEYWIPAENLQELNRNIVGLIEIVHSFTD